MSGKCRRTKQEDKISDAPLCATCRVIYKNCERMQSDFRIIPEGAHYNAKGVLTVCPKYKV